MRVLDLFAGAGGFSLGFHMAGHEVVGALETDAWACDTFRFNHPEALVWKQDISKASDADIVEKYADLSPDIIIGGPPCQGFSIANRKAGDPKDPRNSLFKDFVRIGSLLRPQVMIMENVPNLLTAKTAQGEQVIDIICRALEALGFCVYWKVLQAKDFGVPQTRTRLFVVASRTALAQPFPEPTHRTNAGMDLFGAEDLLPCPTLWEAISDLPPLEAGQGAEEQSYGGKAQTDYQRMMRGNTKTLYNHKAMNHSKRMVERFASMACGQSVSDVPEHLRPRKR
ncbi:MAG: DNA cytosine methyltransferase, partial [Brachymonas sp.]|nr:DNA cytosine methyltransferase [Brachymonas sp.]